MKGGREFDAKVTAAVPLFPRLHVNDVADKGGPRAPPRNKMALYEQLSIPSSAHRFGQHHASAVAAAAVPVAKTLTRHGSGADGGKGTATSVGSQGLGCSRTRFPPHYLQQTSASRNDLQSADIDGLSAMKPSCKKNFGNEDDFMVPTFVHSVAARPSCVGPPSVGRCSAEESQKVHAKPTCSESNQNQDVVSLHQDQLSAGTLASKSCERNDTGQKAKETATLDLAVAGGNTGEPSKRVLKAFSFLENDRSAVSGQERSIKGRALIHRQTSDDCNAGAARTQNRIDATGEAGTIWLSGGKLPGMTDYDTPCTPTMDLDGSEGVAATGSGAPILEDDEDSETSVVDSEPGFDVSPDDVVGTIGAKHFWKARRAIVNQQRVFAVQVFELHRLIKVQKLIAASPQVLLESNPCLTRSRKIPSKKQHSVRMLEPITRKDDSQKEKHNEPKTEAMRGSQHPPGTSHKRPLGQISQNEPHSGGNSSLFHMGSGRPPGSWCFPPSGNQWLVPVMSPSEGLVYKPYVGPCPPSGAFMAPFFGGCGPPVAAPPVMSDCVSPVYGIPSSLPQPNVGFGANHAVVPSYFPTPYGFPVANQVMSPPAMEQVILPRGNSSDHSLSLSSDNMSNHGSEAASGHGEHEFQNDQLHMSTASSPTASGQDGAGLPANFVMLSHPVEEVSAATMHTHGDDTMPRVIKVVPHNRRTASETAARIFQSIQEERQHHDLL